MKKVILFLWFGDEKPPYIQWTLDNFRKMNPGWEIRFIEYSTNQILNYKDLNDEVLNKVMSRTENFGYMGNVSNKYRFEYLQSHKDELIIYCDLDCFPIAPFDNFICPDSMNIPEWIHSIYCSNEHFVSNMGVCANVFGETTLFKGDIWCVANNKKVMFDKFLQIHKGSVMNDTVMFFHGFLINKQNIPEYKMRNKDFHEMKIKLGDNFCLPQFTPIEHYYSYERNKLNLNAIS